MSPHHNSRCLMAALKPQQSFDVPPDNSDAPFVPPHRPGIVPVGKNVPHPMESEIAEALCRQKSMAVPQPTRFTELKDVHDEAWIDTPEALQAMVEQLTGEPAIAVGLKHHDYRSFMGFTCLLQISTRQRDWVVDAIRLRSHVHGALAAVFEDPNVVKVLHGANSDVTWLERDFGIYVINMFDTCLASEALEGKPMSLDRLQEVYCSLKTSKRHKKKMQCSDWRKRPLSAEQLKYARSDTHYLLYMYDCLRQLLFDAGKLHDVLEASADYSRKRYVKPAVNRRKFKAKGFFWHFKSRRRRLLHAIVKWRFEEARAQDESLSYVMSNRVIYLLAKHGPLSKTAVHEALGVKEDESLSNYLGDVRNVASLLAMMCSAKEEKLDEECVKAVKEQKKDCSKNHKAKTAAEKEATATKSVAEKKKSEKTETAAAKAENIDVETDDTAELNKVDAPKPQLTFDVPPDNSDAPFVPPHRPGIVPVGKDVPHPMESEIAEALLRQKAMAVPQPTLFTELKDVDEGAWIDTPEALQAMVEQLNGEPAIAVDLEHHDYRSFMGFTCLLQISTRQRDWVVDTIRLRSHVHSALVGIFENPNVVKVLHGANSDVTWLERDFGIYVINMFDTCLASEALEGKRMSLDHLQEVYCGLKTSKTHKTKMQRSDWRKRPLSAEQLKYARSDTHYLLYIYDRLRQLLFDAGKLHDVLEASADYSRKRYVKPTSNRPKLEKKGFYWNFNARQFHLLHAIKKWRFEARAQDEGCSYIMDERVMFQLAKHGPMSKAALHEALGVKEDKSLSHYLGDAMNIRRLLAMMCSAKEEKLDEEWVKAVNERKKAFLLNTIRRATSSTTSMRNVKEYVDHQQVLVELERAASREETNRLPTIIVELEDQRRIFGGRHVASLVVKNQDALEKNDFVTGDVISVADLYNGKTVDGVVKSCSYGHIEVFLNKALDEVAGERGFLLKHKENEVTFDRFCRSLNILKSAFKTEGSIRALLGLDDPKFEERQEVEEQVKGVSALDKLNDSQRDAVMHALTARDASVIHGPPGTGKTTTVAAIVMAEVARGHRVLICAPSNVAIDGFAAKLVGRPGGVRLVRIGNPLRVSSWLLPHSPEYVLKKVVGGKTVKDVLDELAMERDTTTIVRNEYASKFSRVDASVLEAAQVIATTVAGAGGSTIKTAMKLFGGAFDVVVVDEAGQIPEAGIWTALLRGRKAVLAGDPKQLPPTVISRDAQRWGLERSLLDRIFDDQRRSKQLVRMLNVQYRMHRTIADWCSVQMYGGKLRSAPQVESRTLSDLPNVHSEPNDLLQPFLVLETAFCQDAEEVKDNGSYKNIVEVGVVKRHVDTLLSEGVQPNEIGVISPYKRQVEAIRDSFRDSSKKCVEVATVDSFQGREKEVIIISMVRANADENIGFLRDNRRINVAITRAKRAVVVICNSSTVRTSTFIDNMLHYATSHGEYRVVSS